MTTSDDNKMGYARLILGLFVALCFLTTSSVSAFAEKNPGNPPDPAGGQATHLGGHHHHRAFHYHAATEKLAKMKAKRDRLAAQGADPEKLAKIDAKIAARQAKLDEFKSKFKEAKGGAATTTATT